MSSENPKQSGSLYLVATPIGNLEDITLRALRLLNEVDLIACEDTRHTQKLLNHFNISKPTTSYHEHNELTRAKELTAQMLAGTNIALVTDAGMPGISDPGFRLISEAIRQQVPVIPVPGPSAFLSALAACGLPSGSFCFAGFLPAKRGERRSVLQALRGASQTQAFYEAPHRILETLQDIVEVLGAERKIVVARELTKMHEEFLRGTASEILQQLKSREVVKGEITLLIAKAESAADLAKDFPSGIRQRLEQIMVEEGMEEKSALKKVAKERGISKSEAYRELQRARQ